MGAHQLGGDDEAEAGAAGRVEPWNASNRCARACSEKPGPVSATSMMTTAPSRRPVMRTWSRDGVVGRPGLQRLHGVAGEIESTRSN